MAGSRNHIDHKVGRPSG